MTDTVAAQHRDSQMFAISGFTAMWPEQERVEPSLSAPRIERGHISKQVVNPVAIWGVLFRIPLPGHWELFEKTTLDLALVVHAIEPNDSLEEDVKITMALGVPGYLEKGLEDILDNLLERLHQFRGLEDVIEAGDLDQPSDIVGEKLIVHHPCGEPVPFIQGSPIDGNPPLYHLILA